MTDDDLRDRFGEELAAALSVRSRPARSADITATVQRDARRIRTRRRVIAATLAAAVALTGVGFFATRNHRSTGIRVATTPSTGPKSTGTTPTTLAGDRAILQQFTPTSASTWWATVDDNLTGNSFVVRTVDSGQHWHDVTPPTGEVASSYFLNPDAAWVEAGALARPKSEPVYRTLNGGQSWQRLGQVPSDCQLDFVDQLHGWCALLGGAAGSMQVDLSRTSDGGSTWTLVSHTSFDPRTSTPGSLPFGCDKTITFTSPTVGWASSFCAGGSPYLYRTSDGGSTWHALAHVPLPKGGPTPEGEGLGVPVVHGSNVALTFNIGGQPGATAISTSGDDGKTWRTQLVPDPTKQWNVDLLDPTHWRLTDGKVLIATDDAGNHWRTTTPLVIMKDPLRQPSGLKFLSPLLGWALAAPDGGPLWWTIDGGITWKPVTITAGPYQLPTPARGTTALFPCPVSPVTASVPADDQAAISQAALEWVHREKHWPDGRVTAVYRVGDTTASPYASLFAYQVPRCGERVAKASWVVELWSDSQSRIGASVAQSQTVVAHFADGWRVWGVYH
jgi:photosystem II stability/assembly factor-like uncharacterized protein